MLKIIISNKLKIILFSTILIILGFVIAIFFGYRHMLDRPDILISSFKKNAQISLDKIHQTATKNGIKEWSLDADSAQLNNKKKQVLLKDLSVTFFLKDGKKVDVTANRGILMTDSKDIVALGNVVVNYKKYRMNTEKIHYKHRRRIIFSKTPVKIFGETVHFNADTMFYDLNSNQASLKGSVEGTLRESFQL